MFIRTRAAIRSIFLSALALGACGLANAAITTDLSYVNMQSQAFSRFRNWVDQAVGGNPGYEFSANDAVVMFRLTNQSQYCILARNMVEAQVATAEAAIAANQNPEVAHDSYLYAGAMIGDLALTYDWCSTYVSASQRTRWSAYAERTISNIWYPNAAQWGTRPASWSGWGTNDPANNYYYSFLRATMYWALASGSSTWTTYLQTQKLPPLEDYFATLIGGGSEEGTGYGTSHHKLFELYRVWRDSTGTDLANANSHLTDTISYWLHATVPTRNRFAPYGDQSRSSNPEFYDYHRHLLLEARYLTSSPAARDLASWWINHNSVQQMASGFNYRDDLLPPGTSSTLPAAPLTYRAAGVGHLFTRTSWETGATWLSFSAGSYSQSHAHQDQGSFTLFSGDWLAVTENIWSHSGIQQGTEVHNVVRFVRNGANVRQREPSVSSMNITQQGPGPGEVHVTGNLSAAYIAGQGVNSWQRSLDFTGTRLLVTDQFSVLSGTTAIFQVNTPTQPIITGNTAKAGGLTIRVLQPANATLSAVNWRNVDSDFLAGWKLEVQGGSTNTGFVVEMTMGEAIFTSSFDP
ncbi:heparinase II/III family protein [Dokdonella immobilis]|uniref:Heparinase II/III-like protein n=1 Tax=Dokdonella immobilis TaxID=578942 RepID=A0A1I4VGK5_9GAMM|nr:heparinase II/III family protein [Dokdonella immobilis]SFN00295.1 Heparinase II/III-like protein [Dokdonella immobilis]